MINWDVAKIKCKHEYCKFSEACLFGKYFCSKVLVICQYLIDTFIGTPDFRRSLVLVMKDQDPFLFVCV